MNPAPAFQLYQKDWLLNPAIRNLSPDQRGRYIDVLARTHLTDHPGICPEDEVRRWAGYTHVQWKKHREAFARLFNVQSDGTWIQESTIKARESQRKRHEHSSKGGFLSAARPRDSQGHFVAGLDEGLDPELDGGPGTPSSSPSSASPTSKKNQPNPAAQALRASQEPATPNGAANEPRGPESVGEIMARAIRPEALRTEQDNGRGFSDKFLDQQQARYQRIDVRAIAAQIREEMPSGKIDDPKAVLVYRCKQASGEPRSSRAPEAQR